MIPLWKDHTASVCMQFFLSLSKISFLVNREFKLKIFFSH